LFFSPYVYLRALHSFPTRRSSDLFSHIPLRSENYQYRNRAGCIGVPDNGPIPDGRYHIVNRPSGGWKGVIRTDLHDFYSWPTSRDRKSTRLNSSHVKISYAVFCLK